MADTSQQGQGQELYAGTASKAYTVFTDPGRTKLIVSVQQWTKVTLRLESPGPVSFGTSESLLPVTSGKGRVLPSNNDVEIVMVPQTRLYIAADSIQRVGIQVEPYPWMWEIYTKVKAMAPAIGSLISNSLAQLLGRR